MQVTNLLIRSSYVSIRQQVSHLPQMMVEIVETLISGRSVQNNDY